MRWPPVILVAALLAVPFVFSDASEAEADYEVSVYLGPDEDVPDSGRLLGSFRGHTDDDGAAFTRFYDQVRIGADQEYSVVIRFADGTSYLPLYSAMIQDNGCFVLSDGEWSCLSSTLPISIDYDPLEDRSSSGSSYASVVLSVLVVLAAVCACVQVVRARD